MPNEITQKLGFDANQAIQTLKTLNTLLEEFKRNLAGAASAAQAFNQNARAATNATKSMVRATGATKQFTSAVQGSQNVIAGANRNLQTTAVTAQNLQGLYTQAVTGMGVGTQRMATQVSAGASKVSTTMTKAGTAMSKAGVQGTQAARSLTLSWRTVFRVIQAQLIIRAFSAITRAMGDAARRSIEFQVAMAEIRSIAPPTLGSLEKMSKNVRELSSSLGVASDIVAEGLYQTLSNQVVEAGQAFTFLEQAQKLALVTHAETRDAVNALSSVMNSYQLASSEAEHVAGTLFKTIELGRLRLGEFADILGRVTPLTAELGISWEEVAASLAVMTRQGVKVNTAVTQLRAITLKLIKPTKEMQDLFRQWGVRDAEQAIQKFGGLIGVLKELAKESGGSSAEMAKFFNRVRAIAGQMGIMADDGRLVTETLEEIKEATKASTEAFDEYQETPARRVQKAIVELNNTFDELGEKAIPVLADLLEFIIDILPEVETFEMAFKDIGAALVIVAKAAAVFAAAMVEGMAKVSEAMAGVGRVIRGLRDGTIQTSSDISKVWAESADAAEMALTEMEKEDEQRAEHFAEIRDRMIKKDKLFWKDLGQQAWGYFSEISIIWQRMESVVDAGIASTAAITSRMWGNVIESGRNAIKSLADMQDNFNNKMRDNIRGIAEMRQRFEEQDFQLAKENAQGLIKDRLIMEQADKKLAEARERLAKAGVNEEKLRHSLELANRAQELALERIRFARSIKNRGAEYQAQKQLTEARETEEKIREQQGKALQRVNDADVQQFRNNVERKIELIQQLNKRWSAIQEDLAKQEDQSSVRSSQLRQDLAEVESEIRRNLLTDEELKLAEALGIEDGLRIFNVGIQQALREAKFSWETEVSRLQSILNRTTFKLQADFGDLSGELGTLAKDVLGRGRLPFEDPGQFLGKAFEQAKDTLQDYKVDEVRINELTEELARNTANVRDILAETNLQPQIISQETVRDLIREQLKAGKSLQEAQRIGFKQAQEMGKAEHERFAFLEKSIEAAARKAEESLEVDAHHLDLLEEQVKQVEARGHLSLNNAKLLIGTLDRIRESHGTVEEARELAEEWDDTPILEMKQLILELGTQTDDFAKKIEQGTKLMQQTGEETSTVIERVGELQTAEQEVTTTLDARLPSYDSQLEKLDQVIAKEQQLGKIIQNTTIPSQQAVQAAPEAPTAIPTQDVQTATDNLGQLQQKAVETAQTVPAIGESFRQVQPSVNELVLGVTAIEEDTASTAATAQLLGVTWTLLAEKIAESTDYLNNFITHTTEAKTQTDNLKVAWDNIAISIGNASIAAGNAAQAMGQAAQAAVRAAQACAQAAQACAGGSVRAAKGGQYFAAGGGPRGVDRIPIWAAPREFIVNARSARNFYPQLQAINAGQQPMYRDRGGIVNNVGDINVTVQGGESSQQTVREIASGLRRELRRKTVRLY